jgi:hypothetical protein
VRACCRLTGILLLACDIGGHARNAARNRPLVAAHDAHERLRLHSYRNPSQQRVLVQWDIGASLRCRR